MAARPKTLLIACGALAREIVELIRANGWSGLAVTCLPADWHNTPDLIPDGVRRKIREARERYDEILVLYGDCGTGGALDKVCAEEGVERIPGPHCYSFYMGGPDFDALMDADPTAFFLTDYLARHFDRLIIRGLGIDRHPELQEMYFGNYTRMVYLAQTEDRALDALAGAAAERLGLAYERRGTGYGEMGAFMARAAKRSESDGIADDRLLA